MHDFFYRILLRLLPAEFRGDYGREMAMAFRDERRAAPGPGALAGLWMATLADILKTAPTEHWDILKRDVRFTLRTAMARPAHTLTSVFTLGLGLGASVLMFAVVDAVMLQPLPYGRPEEIVMVQEASHGGEASNLGYLTFVDLRERARSVESMAAISLAYANLTGGQKDAERVSAMRASASYFHLIGVAPALGRAFTEGEDRPGSARRVTILTDALWRRRFGADPSLLGRPIDINGNPFVVIGVMPPDFEDLVGQRMYEGAQMWVPLGYDPAASFACRTCRHLRVLARLNPGTSPAVAQRDMSGIIKGLGAEYPKEYDAPSIQVARLDEMLLGPVRTTLSVLSFCVLGLLLVACGTVANLLLLRAGERTREIAVRAALGVSPGRMARQLTTESLLLSFAGGALGLLAALAAAKWLSVDGPMQLPRLAHVAIDGRAVGMALTLVVLSGLLFGLAPLRQLLGRNLAADIHGAGRTTSASWRLRASLVGANVAMTAVLLVGSGLLVRSLVGLLAVNPGFDPTHVLTLRVSLSGSEYEDDDNTKAIAKTTAFYDHALARIRALPGVTAASGVTTLPLGGGVDGYGLHLASRPLENPETAPSADRFVVTPGYFDALAMKALRGRLLSEADGQGRPDVVVINERIARDLFKDTDPLGQQIMLGPPTAAPRTIVGIVPDVAHHGLDQSPGYQVYVPQSQWAWAEGTLTLLVRSSGEAAALAPPVRRLLREIDPRQPITDVWPYEEIIAASTGTRRLATALLTLFALSAFMLAVVGLYGAVSVLVGQQQREIGVRLVLGARAAEIRGLVLAKGMTPALLGLLCGLLIAAMATTSVGSLLYGVLGLDPVTFAFVFASLAFAAALACAIPARRASRTDPSVTLRAE
ncbi:MAG: ABC transporter permease [Vicinamibacteria bacterium]